MLHSSCLQCLNKDCLSCYFSSFSFYFPHTCHSHSILLIFVSPSSFYLFIYLFILLTLCFPLSLVYLSVRHKVRLQELQGLRSIPNPIWCFSQGKINIRCLNKAFLAEFPQWNNVNRILILPHNIYPICCFDAHGAECWGPAALHSRISHRHKTMH